MSLRSPLGRVLGAGSAKGGSSHWVSQRLTAVALVLLVNAVLAFRRVRAIGYVLREEE